MIISNSEVTAYNVCERKHLYDFIYGIKPTFENLPPGIRKGAVGHVPMEVYYNNLKDGYSYQDARSNALEALDEELLRIHRDFPDNFSLLKDIAEIKPRLLAYFDYWGAEPFDILEVEQEHTIPIGVDIQYGMKLDLLVKYRDTGDIYVVDNKWVANFKSSDNLKLDGQLPKYVKTLQEEGINIKGAIFNQIRTRSMKDPKPEDLFRRSTPPFNQIGIDRVWQEQVSTAKEIYERKLNPIDYNEEARRTLTYTACNGCMHRSLCFIGLEGGDVRSHIVTHYKRSDYGYSESDR